MQNSDAGVNTLSIFGAPGYGKTTLACALIRQRRISRYLAIDPHAGIPSHYMITGPGKWPVAKDYFQGIEDRKWSTGERNTFSITYTPEYPDDEPAIVAEAAFLSFQRKNMTLIIDEAQGSLHRDVIDRSHPAMAITKRGRHKESPQKGGTGVHIWLLSQRPTDVHRDLTAGGERFFFYLDERGDYDYVRAVLGKEGEKIVRTLPKKHCLYKHGQDVYRGTVDWIGATPVYKQGEKISLSD